MIAYFGTGSYSGSLTYNGHHCIGQSVTGALYLWTQNDYPVYVGITKCDIHKRTREHLGYSKYNRLFQRKLRSDTGSFQCYLIGQYNDINALKVAEVDAIKYYNTFHYENANAYNLSRGGEGNIGYQHTEKTRAVLREKRKKQIITEDTKRKISIANKGRKHTPEAKQKLSIAKLGFKHSEETKNKMSLSKMGHKPSAECIAKRVKAMTGRKSKPFTVEHIEKLAAAKRGKKQSKEHIERRRAGMLRGGNMGYWKGKKHSEEYKQRMRQSLLLAWEKRKARSVTTGQDGLK